MNRTKIIKINKRRWPSPCFLSGFSVKGLHGYIMYRLLIVDDEAIIVNGLYEIFSNMKNLDLDIYKAYSGEGAIHWLKRTRIDIVITDIMMPGISGMQLLDEIHRNWPQCRVIFLTGYDEFEYVYKAIQHNRVSYILKNEDIDKVVSAVENAIEDIRTEIKAEDLLNRAKEQVNIALELFQKDYFIHLINEDKSISVSKSVFEQLDIKMFHDKPVLLLLGQVNNISADFLYWDKIQYLYSVRIIISKYLSTKIMSACVLDENYRLILFAQPREDSFTDEQIGEDIAVLYERVVSFLKGTLEAVQTACMESLGASISFALSGQPCSWEAVSKKYISLTQLLNYRIGTGIEMLLIDNEIKNNVEVGSSDLIGNNNIEILENVRQWKLDTIEMYLESGQMEKYFEVLSQLLEPIKLINNKSCNAAIEAYCKVSLSILSYINRYRLNEKIASLMDVSRLMKLDSRKMWKEEIDYIYQLSKVIFTLQSAEQEKRADNTITYIQKYVEEHLSEELSLVRLAEKVFLNPSYLSRLYKQIMGTNLSEYIDNARIKKAKEYLENANMKINEAAKLVGYESAASFSRFFKKVTGYSPQEYQDKLLSEKIRSY